MTDFLPISAPARHIPANGLAFGGVGESASFVNNAAPLPVMLASSEVVPAPLAGTLDASGMTPGFAPQRARPIWVTLSGEWQGTVELLRSTDEGAMRLPLTLFDGSPTARWTTSVNAPVAEESCPGATYYLSFTRTSGTLTYEVRQ